MNTKGVHLVPIADLLDKEFFIRSYQRGYRWEQEQIRDLLNDFNEFIEQPTKLEEEFYCLQPIVVKIVNEEEKEDLKEKQEINFTKEIVYEVIDGQQRITTILILLHYILNELKNEIHIRNLPTITYEVRPKSKEILQNFIHTINSEKQKLDNKIDFYHMKLVFEAIDDWFSMKEIRKGEKLWQILKLLTAFEINNVKVIWYEVDQDENSVEVFRRFNIGKIPLSNAELIKALLLKDDYKKNHSMVYSISKEWQTIENQLQDPVFWSFINPHKEYASRIELLFDLKFQKAKNAAIQEEDIKYFEKRYGTDKSNVFRYFSSKIKENSDDLQKIWDDCVEIFERINQWYNEPTHFHYIGYLQNRENISKDENVMLDILSYYKDEDKKVSFETKSELTDYLINKIKLNCSNVFFKDKKIRLLYDSKNTKNLRDFFFLFNVEVCCKLSESGNGEEIYRLPFNLHKETQYDIEHIDSQTEKNIGKLKPDELIEFIRDLVIDFEEELKAIFEEKKAQLFIDGDAEKLWENENLNISNLNSILSDFIQVVDEKLSKGANQATEKDSIGNIASLNSTINRSYGNAYYNTKRRRIIEEDMAGTYIPIVTKNIFLKYYSKNVKKNSRWSTSDMDDYKRVMETTLTIFM